MKKVIEIKYGHEFKISRKDIKNNDFFYPVYEQALKQLKEIIEYGQATDSNNESAQAYFNNIIAFCGDRGQGKTSAMLSFSDSLKNASKTKSDEFTTMISELGRKFYVLDVIDPSQMEHGENIISIILSRIFIGFKNIWDSIQDDKQSKEFIAKKDNILGNFQKCYNQIQTIKAKSKPTERLISYEESLKELFYLGDSSNLKTELKLILKELFNLHCSEKSECMLVLQIDDTDLNADKAFEIVEDLRKYFSLPGVVVLMASKIEQLCKIVEQQYHKDYEILLRLRDKPEESPHIAQDEPRHIAAKYLGKLIPENRRIYLPEPSIIPDRTEEIITIKYMKNIDDLTDNEKKRFDVIKDDKNPIIETIDGEKMVNILDIYHGNYSEDSSKASLESQKFQNNILLYLFIKTGIRFATPKYGTHVIMPKTMRGLVDFLALLSRLEDYGEPMPDDAPIADREKANLLRLHNLSKFEQYFLENWIPNNIDIKYVAFLQDLSKTPTIEKHHRVITDIYNILETSEVFSLLNTEKHRNGIADTKDTLYKNDPLYYSVGDVMDALVMLENTLQVKTAELYCFAIRTLYTITMYKLYYRFEPLDRTKPKDHLSILDEFVGGDLFGKNNSERFFPTYQKINQSRGYFSVDNYRFLLTGNVINDKEGWNNQKLFVYESYKEDKHLLYKQDPDEGKTFSKIHFWVSIRFVRRATFRYKWDYPHESYMLLLNMEYLWSLVRFQVANPDRRKDRAEVSIFLKQFYKNAKEQLEYFEPVSEPLHKWMKDMSEFDLTFLDILFSLLSEKPTIDQKIFPINNHIKDYRAKNTLSFGIKKFKEEFNSFVKNREAKFNNRLYKDFEDLIKTVDSEKWKYEYTKKYKKIIQELVDSLEYNRGD